MAADGVILDLEDAVPPAQKAQAREWVVAALRRVDFGGRERIVRVNALGTRGARGGSGRRRPAGSRRPAPAQAHGRRGPRAARRGGGATRGRERAPAGRRSASTSWSRPWRPSSGSRRWRAPVPRAAALFYGAGDLARETRARLVPERRTELYAMSRIVLVARADGPRRHRLALLRPRAARAGSRAHTRVGADLGFDGKALIHPTQIEAANRLLHAVRRGGRRGPAGPRRLRGGGGRGARRARASRASSSTRSTSTWPGRRSSARELARGAA